LSAPPGSPWCRNARSCSAVARDDDSGDLIVLATKSNLPPATRQPSPRLVDRGILSEDGITHVGRVE
jgi:hypothetical protein